MRAFNALVGLASAIAVLESLPGALAREPGSFWARLRRSVGLDDSNKEREEPPYHLYDGPVSTEEKEYSYPPYGYPPYPTESSSWYESYSSGKPPSPLHPFGNDFTRQGTEISNGF